MTKKNSKKSKNKKRTVIVEIKTLFNLFDVSNKTKFNVYNYHIVQQNYFHTIKLVIQNVHVDVLLLHFHLDLLLLLNHKLIQYSYEVPGTLIEYSCVTELSFKMPKTKKTKKTQKISKIHHFHKIKRVFQQKMILLNNKDL